LRYTYCVTYTSRNVTLRCVTRIALHIRRVMLRYVALHVLRYIYVAYCYVTLLWLARSVLMMPSFDFVGGGNHPMVDEKLSRCAVLRSSGLVDERSKAGVR